MIHDVIYSLFVLFEKLTFFNKQLYGFIIGLRIIISSKCNFFKRLNSEKEMCNCRNQDLNFIVNGLSKYVKILI